MNSVHRKARNIAGIFNVLAKIIAVFGGTVAFLIFITGFGSAGDPLFQTAVAIVIGITTTVSWAAISLAALIAGYISERVQEPIAPPMAAPTLLPAWVPPQQQQPGPQWRDEPQWR